MRVHCNLLYRAGSVYTTGRSVLSWTGMKEWVWWRGEVVGAGRGGLWERRKEGIMGLEGGNTAVRM